jgi:hypothetical protein
VGKLRRKQSAYSIANRTAQFSLRGYMVRIIERRFDNMRWFWSFVQSQPAHTTSMYVCECMYELCLAVNERMNRPMWRRARINPPPPCES